MRSNAEIKEIYIRSFKKLLTENKDLAVRMSNAFFKSDEENGRILYEQVKEIAEGILKEEGITDAEMQVISEKRSEWNDECAQFVMATLFNEEKNR